MGASQKVKDQIKKQKTQDEIKKASEEVAKKCLEEIAEVLKKHNCTLEVRHKEDTVMGERVLRFGPVVMHRLK